MRTAELAALARQARKLAYAPYSHFQVGAALLTIEGKVYTGANVENISYGLSICAERVAIFKAVVSGERQFQAIAISGSGCGYINPCGACLQVMSEFSPQMKIISTNEKGELREYSLKEMLPYMFSIGKDDGVFNMPAAIPSGNLAGSDKGNTVRREK